MMIVGMSGGFDPAWDLEYDVPYDFVHDAAAVLLDDGRMVAGIEQERLSRMKHTNRSPAWAVRACLDAHGVRPGDVERFAFYATEEACNQVLYAYHVRLGVGRTRVDIRTRLAHLLEQELGCAIDRDRLHFADHHTCHALGAYVHSGYDDALVVTLDGAGEGNSALVLTGKSGKLETLRSFSVSDSLGYLYREVIRFLGYDMFEEYKVMGLAPYGDPARFRAFFADLYTLQAEGDFRVFLDRVPWLHRILTPRRGDEPFTTIHEDVAAALQEALETVVFHVLRHFRASTGERKLCLAGGVAHNSTLNGKILGAGLFDDVFVHPAAHDAGGALGAALHAHMSHRAEVAPAVLDHVFVGRDLGGDAALEATLKAWAPLVSFERMADPCRTVARLLADGAIVGWVQGRSEFGPRALGNRSILGDPRPAENKSRINRMIKKREAYRPFAPSVLQERAREFFELPESVTRLPYMTFVVPVREDKRALLGAVTHVDGSARIQTVSREDNLRYWTLIREFDALTGVPILLNTSFNNNAEPIVDTLADALACYLTTGLDYLVAGDYLVTRNAAPAHLEMAVAVPFTVAIREVDQAVSYERRERFSEIYVRTDKGRRRLISDGARELLGRATPATPLADLFRAGDVAAAAQPALLAEILELWAQRLVVVAPIGAGA